MAQYSPFVPLNVEPEVSERPSGQRGFARRTTSVVFIDVTKLPSEFRPSKEGYDFLSRTLKPSWTFELSSYTLNFREKPVENAYRIHILRNAQEQNRFFVVLLGIMVVILAVLEYEWQLVEDVAKRWLLAVRMCIVAMCICLYWMSTSLELHTHVSEKLLAVIYNLMSLCFVLVQILGTVYSDRDFTETNKTFQGKQDTDLPIYYFFNGIWAVQESLVFIAFLFHCRCVCSRANLR